ncbi:primosomal protein N' [Candidatus Peregrinibacteria bacterium]|nr:primosomal protein N' [Candidatus Peregrinibacteria bacterium]
MKYAQIVVFRKLGAFDSELTYKTIQSCQIGSFVEVPFMNHFLKGVVVGLTDTLSPELSDEKIKPVHQVLAIPPLGGQSVQLARFIAAYYQTSVTRAFRLFLPAALWKGKLAPPVRMLYRIKEDSPDLRGEKQKQTFEAVRQSQPADPENLKLMDGFSAASLKTLLKKGVIEETAESLYPFFDPKAFDFKSFSKTLTADQEEVLQKIREADRPVLLHGITSSGKTEIYLREIIRTVQAGKQAILLVPEIALTPQTVCYFKDFLNDRIAVFHSKLSDGERLKEWWKVKTGYAPLVIGSRSAVFAPVSNLGLVILDEEHEWTYKQESTPYYQTQRVAEEMGKLWGATLIFGSATPSAESYYKAETGGYVYLTLKERIHQEELPAIHLVDLRDEFKKRNFSVFSLMLQQKIKERLENKEQVILFVNQRGLASAVVCRDCGYTELCPHCDIALKLHRNSKVSHVSCLVARELTRPETRDTLVCHYCNYSKAPELVCPECRSPYIKHVGVGTQRVEEEVKRLFPQARVVRADRDTTQGKAGFDPIYHDFRDGCYDILIGTQMIAKGLDFSNVSLIGIVLADIGLHRPDFRSSERLFQVLTQVAGRCGRRGKRGEVVLQTYNPDHPTLKKAASHDYTDFIEEELKQRKSLGYPPFNRMVKFTVTGQDETKLSARIQQEQEVLEDIFKLNKLDVKIVSAPALLPKMANRYYYHVLLRAENPTIVFDHWKPPKGWRIDVDPVHTT